MLFRASIIYNHILVLNNIRYQQCIMWCPNDYKICHSTNNKPTNFDYHHIWKIKKQEIVIEKTYHLSSTQILPSQ
jgi:hypothetical protein